MPDKKTKVMWYYVATEGTPDKATGWSTSVIELSGQMHNGLFKRWLQYSLQLHSNNFGLKRLLKSVIAKALEYKTILKLSKLTIHYLKPGTYKLNYQ